MMASSPVVVCVVAMLVAVGHGLYSPSDDVYDLNPNNFDKMVIDSHFVWIVEFYAPWCGHCQALTPEYKKAATALKGMVRLGAVNADEHRSLGGRYGVQGFPSLKVFGTNKNSPTDYKGGRTADAIVQEALSVAKSVVNDRLHGKGGSGGSSGRSSGGSGGGGGSGNPKDVIELTDSNFEELVINSEDYWLVEFFAPWCGHCKSLAPHWASAATELKGKYKLGALDATVHKVMGSRFGVQGFPTIKFFPSGKKKFDSVEDYDGGRTSGEIVSWAMSKWTENLPPPEVYQLTSQSVLDACFERQICMISFLSHILDSQAAGRNGYIQSLLTVAERYKTRSFGWVWIEGGQNTNLEQKLDVGGFGYPALVAVNSRRKMYSVLRGAFSEDGIVEYVRELVGGRGRTITLKGDVPPIADAEPWDGKDGQIPTDDDYDLSDFDMDGDKDEL